MQLLVVNAKDVGLLEELRPRDFAIVPDPIEHVPATCAAALAAPGGRTLRRASREVAGLVIVGLVANGLRVRTDAG